MVVFIKFIKFDIFMLYLFKIGVYFKLIEFILLFEHNDDIKIIFFADSMWTPCGLQVESMWSPLESMWNPGGVLSTPCGLHVDSRWTPYGVHRSTNQKRVFLLLHMESSGVYVESWSPHGLYGGV